MRCHMRCDNVNECCSMYLLGQVAIEARASGAVAIAMHPRRASKATATAVSCKKTEEKKKKEERTKSGDAQVYIPWYMPCMSRSGKEETRCRTCNEKQEAPQHRHGMPHAPIVPSNVKYNTEHALDE